MTIAEPPRIASRDEWLEARIELLAREKELTRLRDRLNVPWIVTVHSPTGVRQLASITPIVPMPAAPPVALVHLPVRVPYGFHGLWIPDAV